MDFSGAMLECNDIGRLTRAAQNGDKAAFGRLVDTYHEKIHRLVFFRTRSCSDAEDITQEVFFKAFRSLRKLDDPEKFQSWLYAIAINKVRDHYRRNKIRALFFLSSNEDDVGDLDLPDTNSVDATDKVAGRQFWEYVDKLSKELTPAEREVFYLRFLDQLELKEIASVLEKSEGTIKTLVHRAVKKFKQDKILREFLEGRVR